MLEHRKILNLFVTVLNRTNTPEYEVITRQLAIKSSSSHSWTIHVRKILHMYNLPLALQLAEHPPAKASWKVTVKRATSTYWEEKLKQDAAKMKSLRHLNLNSCWLGYSHPVWHTGHDPMQTTMATVKATLLVDRYPLSGLKCAGKNRLPCCPHCSLAPETLTHFLLHCPLYDSLRETHLRRLQLQASHCNLANLSPEEATSIILDPSHIARDDDEALALEETTRRYCFALHSRRADADGRGPMYGWASRRSRARGRVTQVSHNNSKSQISL